MNCQILCGLGAAAALITFVASSAQASPVAMASNMVGKPEFRQGNGPWKPLGVLQRLSPGDTVKCGPGQQAILMMFLNGTRYRVAAGHTGTVGPTAVAGADTIGGTSGATIRVAKAMTGLDTQPFLARPGHSFQRVNDATPGVIIEGSNTITWAASDAGIATYSFTLFDADGNVLWNSRVSSTSATYPSDLPPLKARRPYLWTLSSFGASGKPLVGTRRWGVVTVLSQADYDKMAADAADLNTQAKASPTDPTPLLLLAELYRQYGVLNLTIETLDNLRTSLNPEGTQAAEDDAVAQVSPFATLLYNLDHKGASAPDTAQASQ